jgi:HD superfamily phosphodiesterase
MPDERSFRAADSDNDHCLAVAKLAVRVSKQAAQKLYVKS